MVFDFDKDLEVVLHQKESRELFLSRERLAPSGLTTFARGRGRGSS